MRQNTEIKDDGTIVKRFSNGVKLTNETALRLNREQREDRRVDSCHICGEVYQGRCGRTDYPLGALDPTVMPLVCKYYNRN